MKQNLIFDLDDTLSYCNKYFELVINKFIDQMLVYFKDYALTREEIRKKQLEIDLASIDQNGLTSHRFPDSFVQTYKHYCTSLGRGTVSAEMDFLCELGESVFKIKVEPLPSMYETLQQLVKEGHELYLYTGGDEENQCRKINQLELSTFFHHNIFISIHKDTKALKHVLDTIQADPKNTWMIGNSLRTDIKPALELGINAVHIPAALEWEYNIVDIDIEPTGAFLTIDSLEKLPGAIREYISTTRKEYNGAGITREFVTNAVAEEAKGF
ncbi:HAD family hydrolase [Aneurinibacillus sp. Ricciae_BoGa-3]|uniref:HAD family hydrolase n=1 Tax=Aneurinibacillus sp. Ricciae_BoGa-3 TaxID=3022697 RepID=UPI0023412A2E|nr:HAD family hydrolase [Aneurinibacillus sp. Ricciae_BoGa-3]WCK53784.1 HAD family hydrolase [Aneurinibacillus sp. Ricciae_BoGa-3]